MVSAVMGAASLTALSSNAAGEQASKSGMVIFGDSIASGYGLNTDTEYNYGQICADYLGCNVKNYAVSGDTSEDMLNVIAGLSDADKDVVSESEYVVISIGGNDIINYMSKCLINFAAKKGYLNEGYTKDDLPEDPGLNELMEIVNLDGKGGLFEAAKSDTFLAMDLISELKKLATNLRYSTDTYEGIIPNIIIPNIEKAASEIRKLNPDARIIVQTVYQPVQIDPDFVSAKYGTGSVYARVIGQLRTNFSDVMNTFSEDLRTVEDIEIADVYYEFTSVDSSEAQNASNPGHANFFTDIQESGKERDLHPNQKGHLAIAATILKQIGELHDDSGLLSQIYKNLSDNYNYPHIALDTYKTVAGNLMSGDLNFDEKVDARDASLSLYEYTALSAGENSTLSALQGKCADTNNDDMIDSRDASLILSFYAYTSTGGALAPEEYFAQM